MHMEAELQPVHRCRSGGKIESISYSLHQHHLLLLINNTDGLCLKIAVVERTKGSHCG